MKKYIIEITVFLCGALGMALELVAARVLSPYVGSSNLIWTTIIGVMLTSMSIGYWLGGKIADKNPNKSNLSNIILLGAIFTSFIPIFETFIVKNLSNVSDNLVVIALIASSIVFGIPSFVLATVSPYGVKLKDKEPEKIGMLSRQNVIIIYNRKHCRDICIRLYINSKFGRKSNHLRNYDYITNIICIAI